MPTNHHAHRPTLGDALLALYALSRGRRTSEQELARHLGISPRQAERALRGLARLGLAHAAPPRLTMAGLARAATLADEVATAGAPDRDALARDGRGNGRKRPMSRRAADLATTGAHRCSAGALDGPRRGCPTPTRGRQGKMPRSL